MKQKIYVIILLAVGVIAATGCANKKKIARQQEAELRRQQDSIALVQAQQEALIRAEAEALERQRIQDSIDAARKAMMVQTMYIPRMTITAVVQGNQITTPATLRWQRSTAMFISIQPMAGIEMFRIEADTDDVIIIDKLNRRYTRLTYNDLAQMGVEMSFEEIDAWIDEHILAHRNEPQLTMQVSRAGMSGSAVIYTNTIQTDKSINLRATNVETYRKVSLQEMVTGI